jgi:hypothetical protein
VTWILDYHEIHLLLFANPDGRKRAETGLSWRKNTNALYCTSDPNRRGADLNRNFAFNWNCCGGSSGSECNSLFRGPTPASEPETQAIQDYVRAIFPDQRGEDLTDAAPPDATGITIDIHSYGQLVLWPWGSYSGVAPNGAALQTLGRRFAFFNGYSPKQAIELYPADGASDDSTYGEVGVAAYTFELGTAFFQECKVFGNVILPGNMPALLYAARVARTPYLTPAGPDVLELTATPAGVSPGQLVDFTATVDDTRFNNSNGAEATQNIVSAEATIDIPPWITTTSPITYPLAAVDTLFDETVEEVRVTIDTAGLAPGRHTLFVRGQDADGNWGPVSAAFFHITEPGVSPVIEGYVRAAVTHIPMDARVTAGIFHTNTDPLSGYYRMTIVSGTYDLNAVAPGYGIITTANVQVDDYQTLQKDFFPYRTCSLMTDDVEAGSQSWQADGNWGITAESSHSPTHSWTDSPGGDYGNNWTHSLTGPSLNLSTYQGTTLSFWHSYSIEFGWDIGWVEYSVDGDGEWDTAAAITGDSAGWIHAIIPLPALDSQSDVSFRFQLETDGSTNDDGWYIDDIELSGVGPPCLRMLFLPLVLR